jgi:hypothetical protein
MSPYMIYERRVIPTSIHVHLGASWIDGQVYRLWGCADHLEGIEGNHAKGLAVR